MKIVNRVWKEIIMLAIILSCLCSCSTKENIHQSIVIGRDGNIESSIDNFPENFSDKFDFEYGISFGDGGSKIVYVTSMRNSENEQLTEFDLNLYDISSNENKKTSLLNYLRCENYPDIVFSDRNYLIPTAMTYHDGSFFFLANISKNENMIFSINLVSGETWHSKVGSYSSQYLSVSKNNEIIYVSSQTDNIDYIIQYDISTNSSSIYLSNAKGLVFSQNYKYAMYFETKKAVTDIGQYGSNTSYTRTLVIKNDFDDSVIYKEDNCPDYTYNFSASGSGVLCSQTIIKSTVTGYLNKDEFTFINIDSGKKEMVYSTRWGDSSKKILIVD